MNLKVRLAVLYSLSVFIILIISAISIYILNENFRKAEFGKRLLLEAEESYLLFSSVPDLTQDIKEELNENASSSLWRENLIIYDSLLQIKYKNFQAAAPAIPNGFFKSAKENGQHTFNLGAFEAVLIYWHVKNKTTYVFTSASDIFGKSKSNNLKIILSSSVIGGILFSGLMAFFYVRQAMKPLERLKEQIEKINETNLTGRISLNRNNDEITQIAKKFNAMLNRLEEAFEQRKNFVHHASHELRTPLTNMLSQTEAALSKTLSPDDYRKILLSLKEDQQNLIDLTNSLLALSRYEKISAPTHWPQIRIDEMLYQIVDVIKQLWPQAIVAIHFASIPEDEEYLVFEGNESLIRSALLNLAKNAIQYSDNNKVEVLIDASKSGITLQFDNTGRQLLAKEQENLFVPFFRGENAQNKKGYGLGLSIVQRIVKVHEGTIQYQSIGSDINRFTLFFPTP